MAEAYLEHHMMNPPKAEALSLEALNILEANFGAVHLDVAEALLHLAWVEITWRRGNEALKYSTRAARIRQQLLPADDWKIAEAKNLVSWSFALLGRTADSQAVFLSFYPVFEREFVKLWQEPVPPNPDCKLVWSLFHLLGNADNLKRLSDMDNIMRGRSPNIQGGNSNQSCFVATVAYGDPNCTELNLLRYYRDYRLSKSKPGRVFIDAYYKHGAKLANIIERSKLARRYTKKLLDFMINHLKFY